MDRGDDDRGMFRVPGVCDVQCGRKALTPALSQDGRGGKRRNIMAVVGYRYTIEWSNPYKMPEIGQPLVKAEMFETVIQREKRLKTDRNSIPSEFSALHEPGDGYCVCWRAISEPMKQLSKETLAGIRKKRITRRMQKKYPLFAEEMIKKAINENPEYYAGITRADLQADKDQVIDEERAIYEEFMKVAGQ